MQQFEQAQWMITAMGVLAGAWGVTAWFVYRRARATMGAAQATHDPDAETATVQQSTHDTHGPRE